jgi:hypothetical protein
VSSCGQGVVNGHAAWRMAVARRAAAGYAGNPGLAVLAVAGSVGAGLADRFSDLELDCYWSRPPDEAERLAPVRSLGGQLIALWDYDHDDQEWSEDYRVGELDITVSNFLVSSAEQFLDDVVLRADTDPVRHMRLAAFQRCRPLLGAETMASWRVRADTFPDTLVTALVEQALAREALSGWAAREALVSRGDGLAADDLLARAGYAVVRVVLALNRVYLPHRQLKWQRHLVTGLGLAPGRLAERLELMSAGPPAEGLRAAEDLLAEVMVLAEAHSGADITGFRAALAEHRRAIDPPLPVVRDNLLCTTRHAQLTRPHAARSAAPRAFFPISLVAQRDAGQGDGCSGQPFTAAPRGRLCRGVPGHGCLPGAGHADDPGLAPVLGPDSGPGRLRHPDCPGL